ncbi:Leucine-rich repeat-containing protein 43 [Boothiomyces sp. JEL0838]|nr:Leucine-rich repeat-containing protein 43 [Boothiomyces sp. JEL0838]
MTTVDLLKGKLASDVIESLLNKAIGIKKGVSLNRVSKNIEQAKVNCFVNGDYSWCDELQSIELLLRESNSKLKNMDYKKLLKNVRLHGKKIIELDPDLQSYSSIVDLSLTDYKLQLPNLQSLDISWNDLCNLNEVINVLKILPNLQILNMMGNPLVLSQNYRGNLSSNLQSLRYLDELKVNRQELSNAKSQEQVPIEQLCKLRLKISTIVGLDQPIPPQNENLDQPPIQYAFQIVVELNGYEHTFSTNEFNWNETKIDYDEMVNLEVSVKLRDLFIKGPRVVLKRNEYTFINIPQGVAEEDIPPNNKLKNNPTKEKTKKGKNEAGNI